MSEWPNLYSLYEVDEVKLDKITFEVLKNAFVNLVDQMSEQILRTCYSFVIYNRDFSCCLNDFIGDTVMQGSQDIAVHVGTLHYTAKSVLEYFKEDLHPGDVIALNDPYLGGTHFPDVRILRPVFYDGNLIAITQTNGHWADVGGPVPGSFNVLAREHYAEGLRITPVKIWEKGQFRRDVADLIVNNMRVPEERMGDLKAQATATMVGERYLLHLIEKYGLRTTLAAFKASQDYVERILRERIKKLPKGVWETEDYIDYDPSGDYDKPVRVKVKMTISDDGIHYDLSESDKYVGTFLNGAFGSSFSAVIAGTKFFFPDVPLNSGFYRVVRATLPENTVVNAPWPLPVTGFCSGAYEKIMNSIIELWSYLIPERAMACSFNLEYLLVGGWDKRPGYNRHFMWYDWMVGGYGGRNGLDGANASAPLFGMGLSVQPLEGQERLNPVITLMHDIVPDSGGPGKWRGGCGVEKGGIITEADRVLMSYMADRERMISWGIMGGLPSIKMGVALKTEDSKRWLGCYFSGIPLKNGDAFTRCSAGGGGYGDPLERDPRLVLEDVIDGYVTVERARKDYGVIIKVVDKRLGIYEVDWTATERERDYIRRNRKAWLSMDPEKVREMFKKGEIDELDAVRRYGVIFDSSTGEVLPKTTEIFRKMVWKSARFWKDGA
ncbi:MAG: hydantoinase B/oxoprolinase family protein [Candidatus Caldarchaeum sp.]|nr:hydantoinase B/oxoprolinase family protein [Candidatus Caldarchaeum sp.]